MDDLISRQAAIKAVSEYGSVWMEYTSRMTKDEIAEKALKSAKATMIRIVKNLPSAQPMRPKGKWIADVYGNTICSECGWYAPQIMQGCLVDRKLQYFESDFCWKCGADMRGDPNE